MTVIASDVTLIVGLGNPGLKYAANRHNVGFRVVEELARRLDLVFSEDDRTYTAAVGTRNDVPLVLMKPLTYMNLSGEALTAWGRRQGISLVAVPEPEPELEPDPDPDTETEPIPTPRPRILVICDDLALPLGSLRLRARGSSGGQNGLASILDHLDTEAVARLRLGIAPLDRPVDPAHWPDYVLADFAPDEGELVDDLLTSAVEAALCWLDDGLETAVSRFNRRVRPPASE